MKFTARGLIIKKKGEYCNSWEDLFELENRDTPDKRKKFKSKYKDLIKEVKYSIDIVDGSKREYTYMIAHWNLAKNKNHSDMQRVVFENADPCIIQSDSKKVLGIQSSTIYRRIYKDLEESIFYQFDGMYRLIEGMIVDMNTGKVMVDEYYIIGSISDCIKEGAKTNSKYIYNDCIWSVLIHLKERLEHKSVGRQLIGVDYELNEDGYQINGTRWKIQNIFKKGIDNQ